MIFPPNVPDNRVRRIDYVCKKREFEHSAFIRLLAFKFWKLTSNSSDYFAKRLFNIALMKTNILNTLNV